MTDTDIRWSSAGALRADLADAISDRPVKLAAFNRMSPRGAFALLQGCLHVARWSNAIAVERPYRNVDDLFEFARDAAYPLTRQEIETALRYRDPVALTCAERVRAEQSDGHGGASAQLAQLGQEYERRFGRPLLIRTDGRSLAEVIQLIEFRLGYDGETEERFLAHELRQTALLGLARILRP